MTLLEDFPDFSLWHDPSCACLYATWRGIHGSRRTQAQYTLLREYVLDTGSTKLLNDSLLDEDGWSQLTQWIAKQGFSQLAAAGLQVVAWVLPRQPTAFYDTARTLSQVRGLLIDTFTDAQAAYDWLHRWPSLPEAASAPKHDLPGAAAFVLLSPAQQLVLATSQGRVLAPRWEADCYIAPYQLPNGLLVEVFYHLHSGKLHQIQTRPSPEPEK